METRNTPQHWEHAPAPWNSDRDGTLVCCRVREETHDVKSFFFRPRNAHLFRFLPGQFITLELDIDGETVNRSYTISSPPTRPDTLSITVKRTPGGKVSNWLHDHMQVGKEISVLGPHGSFTCAHHPAGKYLFLSGGSGITPLMSMTRTLYELSEDPDIVFVHCARSPKDIIFRGEIDLIARCQERFQPAYVCEKAGDGWLAPTGYLTLESLRQLAPDFLDREIFTCGPSPYMAAVRAMLAQAGFDMKHYHEESFNFEELCAQETDAEVVVETPADGLNGSFSIALTKSGSTVHCAPGQFILDAARAAGLRLPSSCSKGLCGTCKSKLVSGEVDMKHGGGIRQREIDQGMILPCCSTPLSDVVLER